MAIDHMLCPIFVWQISPIETCSGIGSLLIRVGTATVEPSSELDLISASWSESGKRWRVLPDPLPDEFDIRKHSQWRREEILMESKGHPDAPAMFRTEHGAVLDGRIIETQAALKTAKAWVAKLVYTAGCCLFWDYGTYKTHWRMIILPILVGGLENVLFSID